MGTVKEGTLLWEPDRSRIENSNLSRYMKWLNEEKQLDMKDYNSLWNWSVHDIEGFWKSQWDYFNIQSGKPYQHVLSSHEMPGATWFTGSTINYAEHVFRNRNQDNIAIIHESEVRQTTEVTWGQLYRDTAAIQQTLKELGVKSGDRVVAYAPNIYETAVAFLASASLGAVWSSASPDFGTQSVIDRFRQIEPKVMLTIDGYSYGGKQFDRTEVAAAIQKELPTLEATIAVPYLKMDADFSSFKNAILWEDAIANAKKTELHYEPVPFNDPLWVLFSSGTTGKPKPIVHSQGGILLEHLKALTFHMDLDENSRFYWFTTTGWMMWNFLIGGLLTGSTIILYDGNPAHPNKDFLWDFAERTEMTVLGTSASYLTACMKDGMVPKENYQLQKLANISSTGSPLPPEAFQWCYDNVKDDVWISSVSGGTDVCTAFILGAPILPVYAGELQCMGLGAKVESFDENGLPGTGTIGELVLTEPFPSMPIYFWNDQDGSRLQESYFDMYPGIWCHGDYLKITERHTGVIYGRSDATINRGGIRIGTSEIYRAVDKVKEVSDCLIVDIPSADGNSQTPLFVVLKPGCELTEEVIGEIRSQIRTACSPRHVPTSIHQVVDLPRTLNGKKLEVPVKKILMGRPVEEVVNKGSLSNEKALEYFVQFSLGN